MRQPIQLCERVQPEGGLRADTRARLLWLSALGSLALVVATGCGHHHHRVQVTAQQTAPPQTEQAQT